ncbi:MAG: C4-dicarboxylate ABC transporter, partial [Pseudomonadota bacterium]|nr:C4-dicarboxylate ABC transporter [Pseudomonadota bacterium]
MTDDANKSEQQHKGAGRLGYWLAFILVIVGLLNVTPAIPGWDQLWQVITGTTSFKIRRFPTEWLYPIVFFWMMLIVASTHSIRRAWRD